jgi:hypothetical protein
MLNERNEFICDSKGCGKLATRVVSYYRDTPTACCGDPKTEVFCNSHAEAEMARLEKPGYWSLVRDDGSREDCMIQELSNLSVEDCCSRETNKKGKVVVRMGSNVDPALWGFPRKSRGTTFVVDPDESIPLRRSLSRKKMTNSTRKRASSKTASACRPTFAGDSKRPAFRNTVRVGAFVRRSDRS